MSFADNINARVFLRTLSEKTFLNFKLDSVHGTNANGQILSLNGTIISEFRLIKSSEGWTLGSLGPMFPKDEPWKHSEKKES